jgi:hypothetical protein
MLEECKINAHLPVALFCQPSKAKVRPKFGTKSFFHTHSDPLSSNSFLVLSIQKPISNDTSNEMLGTKISPLGVIIGTSSNLIDVPVSNYGKIKILSREILLLCLS